MKIAIGNDHAAIGLKQIMVSFLKEKGIDVVDMGTNTPKSLPHTISGVARLVADGGADGGILICGTGVGLSLAANKVKGICACVCSDPLTARLSKRHNNTNILAFSVRVVGSELAKMIVEEWLNAEFEGGRHADRVGVITEIEGTGTLCAAERLFA